MTTTLLQLRDRIKQRTDNQYTDGFVSDTELDGLINLHYKELYELLQFTGPHRVETEYTVTADGSVAYALPVDVYSIMVVHRVETNGSRSMLERHDVRNRPVSGITAPAVSYRVVGGMRLELDPTPASGDYIVTYVPVPPDLADNTDTLDGVLGWEEYVVTAASLDVAIKESVDTGLISLLERQMNRQRARVTTAAKNAEMVEASRIVDVRCGGVRDVDVLQRGAFPVRWWY